MDDLLGGQVAVQVFGPADDVPAVVLAVSAVALALDCELTGPASLPVGK